MTHTYRCVAIMALTALWSGAATLSGVVRDAQSGTIPNARVTLIADTGDAEWSVRTDSSGNYHFDDVPNARYLLEANAAGFASYRVQGIDLLGKADVKLDLTLSLGAVQQEVTVTAASTPQAVDQVSKALSTVTAASLEDRDVYSLANAIRLIPGLRVTEEGGPGAFSDIRIRGLEPQDTAVLVDGLRLRDPSGTQSDATALLDDFLTVDTNRVEMLRGSGSSLYGTNAIGGVVNVITDQGGGPTHGSLQVEGGNLGLFRGTALVSGGTNDDRFQYSAGITHLNVMDGIGGDQPARTSTVQGRVGFRLTPTTQLVARFFGSDGFALLSSDAVGLVDNATGIIGAIPGVTFTPSIADSDYHRTGRYETGALSILGQPAAALGYAVDYQAVNSTRTYQNGPAGTGFQPDGISRSDYNGGTQTLNARVNYLAGQHNLFTAGYEFEHESYNTWSTATPDTSSNSYAAAVQTSDSVFAQDQIRLFDDRLYLSLGARAQYFSLDQPTFTPVASGPYAGLKFAAPPAAYTGDGSFAYMFRGSGTKIRAHVGRGYRAPSLYERFGAGYDAFFGYSVYGDPRLRPEQSIAVDTGIDQALFKDKLHLAATYFYTRLQRVIAFDSSGLIDGSTDPFGRFIGYLNTHGGLARGVEFSTQWTLTRSLTLSGAYTYTDAREQTPLIPGVYRSFITPTNQFSAFGVQRIGKRIFVDVALTAASDYLTEMFNADFTPIAYRFAGQKRLDAGASYELPVSDTKALRFYAQLENLLDQTFYESGFVTPGVTARGGLQFRF